VFFLKPWYQLELSMEVYLMRKIVITLFVCFLLLISVSTVGAASSNLQKTRFNNQPDDLKEWQIKEIEEYNVQRSLEFNNTIPTCNPTFGEITPQWSYPESRVLNVVKSQQERYYWCGPASIQMMIKYNGKTVSQSTLASEAGTTTSGSNTLNLRNVLNNHVTNHTFGVTRIEGSSQYTPLFNILNSNIFSKSQPVLALVKTERLPYYNNYQSNHYIVARGMTKQIDDGTGQPIISLTQVNLVDPNNNNNYYGYFTVNYGDFFNAVNFNWVQAYNIAY
jgi:hypothetical protein